MGQFPFIHVPYLTGGMVIGLVALFHVVLAHYSVGVGFLLYGFEKADPKGDHRGIQRTLDLLSTSVIYVNFVLGAISGVGIWFAISLYAPDATQMLIQKFVWLWALEWVFFACEIIIGYVYYYNRKRISAQKRLILTRLYLFFTWGSLLVITGILSYMLTSKPGNAIEAWNNASAWPSVFLRTVSAIALASLTTMVFINIKPLFKLKLNKEEQHGIFRVLYKYLNWFFLLLPLGIWYRFSIPEQPALYAEGSSVPIMMFLGFAVLLSVIITVIIWIAYRYKRIIQFEGAFIMLLLGITATFSAEFVREGIRKPYLIRPILYSNGVLVEDMDEWHKQTKAAGSVLLVNKLYPGTDREKEVGKWLLPNKALYPKMSAAWRGWYIYHSECMTCHALVGFNELIYDVYGWDKSDFGAAFLKNIHLTKPFMPPFTGTDEDIKSFLAFVDIIVAPGFDDRIPPSFNPDRKDIK